ncbi:hypothetical protein D3C74_309850 [compost metagenome]
MAIFDSPGADRIDVRYFTDDRGRGAAGGAWSNGQFADAQHCGDDPAGAEPDHSARPRPAAHRPRRCRQRKDIGRFTADRLFAVQIPRTDDGGSDHLIFA